MYIIFRQPLKRAVQTRMGCGVEGGLQKKLFKAQIQAVGDFRPFSGNLARARLGQPTPATIFEIFFPTAIGCPVHTPRNSRAKPLPCSPGKSPTKCTQYVCDGPMLPTQAAQHGRSEARPVPDVAAQFAHTLSTCDASPPGLPPNHVPDARRPCSLFLFSTPNPLTPPDQRHLGQSVASPSTLPGGLPGKLERRTYTCFCQFCLMGEDTKYQTTAYAETWRDVNVAVAVQ